MTQKDKQIALDYLIREMNEKLMAYNDCSRNDEILDGKKNCEYRSGNVRKK